MAWQRADSSDFCLSVHEAETRARVHLWKGGEGLEGGKMVRHILWRGGRDRGSCVGYRDV